MKEKVKELLLKHGNSAYDAEKMIEQEYDSAVALWPDANATKIAEIIRVLF